MNIIHHEAYRSAFVRYLCTGTPIRLSLKDDRPVAQYIWRTRRDEKVRLSHRRNDGRVFSWSDAPDTGHPGKDYNCRCEAVPFIEGKTEFASHGFTTSLASSYERWENPDFIWHFFTGRGREVTLLEIGHLREIVEQYAYADGVEGVFRRLSDQIADEARENGEGGFQYDFDGNYQFRGVEFSHGRSFVGGVFSGTVESVGPMLRINGTIRFRFEDVFTDPVDLREFAAWLRERPDRLWRLLQEAGAYIGLGDGPAGAKVEIDEEDVSDIFRAISKLGGEAYAVTGEWETSFSADVFEEQARSQYWDTGNKTQ